MVSFKAEDVHKKEAVDSFLTEIIKHSLTPNKIHEMDMKWQYLVRPESEYRLCSSELLILSTEEDVKTMLQFCSEHFCEIKHPVIIQVSEQTIREGSQLASSMNSIITAGSDMPEAF